MIRVGVLALVAVLVQPLHAGAQAPAGPYPILFVHGLGSSADTWTVMTTALCATAPSRFGTTVTPLSAGTAFPAQDASRQGDVGALTTIDPPHLFSSPAAFADRAAELDTFVQSLVALPAGSMVTLQWRPAATGGAPSAYILRGTYRHLQGAVTGFDFPLGAATSILVPPGLAGSFTVRVHAVNGAGESPASNEIAFTIPQ